MSEVNKKEGVQKLTHTEKRVYEYLRKTKNFNLVKCAKDLNYPVAVVMVAINSLKEKGLIKGYQIRLKE